MISDLCYLRPEGGALTSTWNTNHPLHTHTVQWQSHSPCSSVWSSPSQPAPDSRTSTKVHPSRPKILPAQSHVGMNIVGGKLGRREWQGGGGDGGRKGNKEERRGDQRQRGISLWVMETDPNSRHAHGEPNRPLCVFVLSRHSHSLHAHNIQQLLETLTVLSLQVNLWKTCIISPVDTHNVCIQHTVSVNVMSEFTASSSVVFFS